MARRLMIPDWVTTLSGAEVDPAASGADPGDSHWVLERSLETQVPALLRQGALLQQGHLPRQLYQLWQEA